MPAKYRKQMKQVGFDLEQKHRKSYIGKTNNQLLGRTLMGASYSFSTVNPLLR